MMLMGFLRILVLTILVFELGLFAPKYWRAKGAEVECIGKEREALLRFKAAHGDGSSLVSWSSWGTKRHKKRNCCEWGEGVVCNNQTGHVIKLHLPSDFPDFPLKGEIHASLMELKYLTYLNLSFNYFEDSSIPRFLGSLTTHLTYLDLHNCRLSGGTNVPTQLGLLSRLQYLDLSKNLVEGPIPHQLGNLSQLQYLNLSWNLNLRGVIPYQLENLGQLQHLDLSNNILGGEIPYQLGNLVQLQHIDLSRNNLTGLVPYQFGNLTQLQHFDLSYNNFVGSIPYQLGKLSNLQRLLLSYAGSLKIDQENGKGHEWLSNLTSLTHLKLGNITDLKYSHKWLQMISNLPNLKELMLPRNDLSDEYILSLPSLKFNTSSLFKLDLSRNNFKSSTIFRWILNISTNLVDLNLHWNHLESPIPFEFASMMNSLENLDLGSNQITGTLLGLSMFPSLKNFDISGNSLNWTIPKDFSFPSSLVSLDVHSNSLKGILTTSHLANLHNLKFLDLSDNSLTLRFSHDWVPPFQLEAIYVRSCKLGPGFPEWLQSQNNFTELDISNTGISGSIPEWFWVLLKPNLINLNISCNNMSGTLPDVAIQFTEYPIISLASNQFEGPLPRFLQKAKALVLSNNNFSDLRQFLCATANGSTQQLIILDLSYNQFVGQLPDCWSNFQSLFLADLSDNHFSGEFPASIGSLQSLRALILRNNEFSGDLFISLKNCSKLALLDAGGNNISNHLTSWTGIQLHDELKILILRDNNISGSLSTLVCYMPNLHLLDLSLNNLSGQIPQCFKNFTQMSIKSSESLDLEQITFVTSSEVAFSHDVSALLMWKGTERIFEHNLLLKGIDLSSNKLVGTIPSELGMLVELASLNLSRNQLDGKIPSVIGQLTSLDYLDLSRNHLIGPIPSSFTQIDRLAALDLSYNNLSGKIPTSTQLQSFDNSAMKEILAYVENHLR